MANFIKDFYCIYFIFIYALFLIRYFDSNTVNCYSVSTRALCWESKDE